MDGNNAYECFIEMYWDKGIKICHIDLLPPKKRQFLHQHQRAGVRLTTLILKPGFRGQGIGSQIIAFLKRKCDKINSYLVVPMGTTKYPNRLRSFYKRNGLEQEFIDGFEYWTYNNK